MEEQEEKLTAIEELKRFVELDCVDGTELSMTLTDEGFQKISLKNPEEEDSWFTLELSEKPEEGKEDDFEKVSLVALECLFDIIEKEIAAEVDALALLN